MNYEAKNYEHLLGIKGFSDGLLKTHFKLYEGYVANTNKLAEKLKNIEHGTPEYSELKRRFGWEWNGMRLHELYFGNLSKDAIMFADDSPLRAKIADNFGSYEAWEKDFHAMGTMRGIGWVVLAQDGERLFNVWINEHDVGHLAGATPLIVMDVFEHAFMADYGTNRADYINAFFVGINWSEVEKRFNKASY